MFADRLVPGLYGALETGETLTEEQIIAKAEALLAQMTLDEKIAQMSGDLSLLRDGPKIMKVYNPVPIPGGENLRLGIPGIRFSDGPRGVVMYSSTCFPVAMARGASWDAELEARIGEAIGIEARSQGANFFGGVCINLLRHPAWGRAQETYGEDPYHLGEMGAALVRGVQRHIMACIKHYACNSIETARFKVDVRVDERTLREIYLPHFKRCIDEGAAAVMGAYNRVNGEFCCHNSHLLQDILRQEWGFEGMVVSDFVWGVRSPEAAANGLDIEMPFRQHFARGLKKAVRKGRVPEKAIDEAVLRILRTKIRFAQVGEPERYGGQAVVSQAHKDLAREAATKSMVLLKNEPVAAGKPLLPIDPQSIQRLAVIGVLADMENTGDHGSSRVYPPYVVTPLQGILAATGEGVEVTFHDGVDAGSAAELAGSADVAVIVAGYTHEDEGEFINILWISHGGDRERLSLSPHDESLIQSVAAANPRTVVVLVGGSAIITEAWRDQVPAILMAWYPGMEGGHALADILFGAANPSGKLPCAFPKSAEQLPFFDKHAETIEYGYYHGYRLMDREGHEPAFPFGYGLSYTTFHYSELRLSAATIPIDGNLEISVVITNTGERAGEEIAQFYIGYPDSRVERPVRDLKGFAKLSLEPGERKRAVFSLPAERLAYYDEEKAAWVVEPGAYTVHVGPSSRAEDLLSSAFRINDEGG